ncbi:hypothetical protein Krad_2672 [Kineococcus radiotolerans SRS30216 = ATCC BAA-149]|uniref:PH domain-containing protein n=1 Tax=Kineococcus radiotolerans (strain ATCC BAA-149 / DSM 14245 / SRS30216) TaxID=266940 RepID=A6WBF5_KINRD|nr:hypothetical protein Krad_2672 [Kineococcus radiotolerans SRS30216 = ATCC BAA-149]
MQGRTSSPLVGEEAAVQGERTVRARTGEDDSVPSDVPSDVPDDGRGDQWLAGLLVEALVRTGDGTPRCRRRSQHEAVTFDPPPHPPEGHDPELGHPAELEQQRSENLRGSGHLHAGGPRGGGGLPPVPVVLGAGGVGRGLLWALAFLLLAAGGWWLSPGDGFALLYFSGQLALSAACVVYAVARHRLDTVRLEEQAIVVVTRRGEKTYAWADVLEVSWQGSSWPYAGSGPVLRLRGGPFDTPGPNAPAQIAHLPIFGRAASRQAVDLLRRAAAAHQVPYTAKLIELINTGKRMPRLPGEPRASTRGGR